MNEFDLENAPGIIILAAGQSSRFGSDKRIARLPDSRTVLETTLTNIPTTITSRILVLHDTDTRLARLYENDWQIVFAKQARAGMGFSLAAGIKAAREWSGALIGLADMPYIQPQTYTAVRNALVKHPIVVPRYQNRNGHPTGFQTAFFAEMLKLTGDTGARSLLQNHQEKVFFMECEDAGILQDIDTRQMLETN